MATVKTRKRTKRTLTLPNKNKTTSKATGTRTTSTGNTLSLAKPDTTTPKPKVKDKPTPVLTRNRQGNMLNKILRDKYPTWNDCVPLQVGIQDAIIKEFSDQFSKGSIRLLLKRHTRKPDYLNNMIEGDTRYNLAGNKAGIINNNDKAYAQKCLDYWDSQKKGTPE